MEEAVSAGKFQTWYNKHFNPHKPQHVNKLRRAAENWEYYGIANEMYADYLLRFAHDYEKAAWYYCTAAVEVQDGDVLSYLRSLSDPSIFELIQQNDTEGAAEKLAKYFSSQRINARSFYSGLFAS
jgi:hypothetical protein